jgi:hypothetical protein
VPLAPPPAPVPDTAPAESQSSIGEIKKEHNIDIGGGRYALRLTVPAELVGQKGRVVWTAVRFADETGALIKSQMPGYADADGNIKLTSQNAIVALDKETMSFTFLVPYGAFPRRDAGKYKVEARARLVEKASPKNVLLATGTTTFFVEG